jgi:putative SOS response-associated peptidase YedK
MQAEDPMAWGEPASSPVLAIAHDHDARPSNAPAPASGYYEWRAAEGGKQTYFISAANGAVLSIAGLWDQWKDPETGKANSSTTLIVTAANEFTRRIKDRMPVLLGHQDRDAWLTGKAGLRVVAAGAKSRNR